MVNKTKHNHMCVLQATLILKTLRTLIFSSTSRVESGLSQDELGL